VPRNLRLLRQSAQHLKRPALLVGNQSRYL
jgi:hypothetical protein